MWTPPERIRHPLPETRWPSREEAAASTLFFRFNSRIFTSSSEPGFQPWSLACNRGGEVTENVLNWYGRFAQGKPGAIVVEATGVRDIASGPLLRIGPERYDGGLRKLVERVREESEGQTRLFIQLIDFLMIRRRVAPAKYFQRFFSPRAEHFHRMNELEGLQLSPEEDADVLRSILVDASSEIHEAVLNEREFETLQKGYRQRVTDVEDPSIRELPQLLPTAFARGAQAAERVGFDGIELHFAHAYTMASFLSRLNTRVDGYGSTLEGRLRLPIEVIQAVKNSVSSAFGVGARILGREVISGGTSLEEARRIATRLCDEGLDFLSISTGGKFEDAAQPKIGEAAYPYTGQSGYECMPSVRSDARGPFARNVGLAKSIRESLRESGLQTPVVAAGGIRSFETAEKLLNDATADIIGAARQSLADPDWFLKIFEGDGNRIRQCQFTNYCEGLDQRHKEVTCRLWDRVAGEEVERGKSGDGKRFLIAPKRRS